MITSEPLGGSCATVRKQSNKIDLQLRCSPIWHSPGCRIGSRQNQKQYLATRERSSTELRFASFPRPLWGVGAAVTGRDEGPAGALDSRADSHRKRVSYFLLSYFLLDMDDFIDVVAVPAGVATLANSSRVSSLPYEHSVMAGAGAKLMSLEQLQQTAPFR